MIGETLFERSSFDARKKIEVSRIVDLSKGLQEKYGDYQGWLYGLRYSANDGPLKYKLSTVTKGLPSAISANLYDDRSTPVEVIRQPEAPYANEYTDNGKNL